MIMISSASLSVTSTGTIGTSVQAGDLRRAPAPFAGDDLKAILRALDRTHDDRLDHAVLPDRIGKLAEFGIGKGLARIARDSV